MDGAPGIALLPLEREEAGPSAPLKNASLRMTPLGIWREKPTAVEGLTFTAVVFEKRFSFIARPVAARSLEPSGEVPTEP
jgi:hypothetical protein